MNYFDVLFAKKLAYNPPLPPVIKRVTGNPIELTDAANAPMVKCVTEIQGSQDLHGYDKPWVGGAGVNLLPSGVVTDTTVNDIRYQCDGNGLYTISGTSTNNSSIIINLTNIITLPSSSLYVHLMNDKVANISIFFRYNGTNVTGAVLSTVNRILSLPLLSGASIDSIVISVPAGSYNVNASFMICDDNVAKQFTPYSNICPITAYTEGEIEVRGKNLFDKDNADILTGRALNPQTGEVYATSNWSVSNYIKIEPSTTYTLNTMPSGSDSVAFYDSEKAYISGYGSFGTRTTPSNAKYVRFDYRTEYLSIMQLEKGSTATTYEPYTSTTHTTTYPSAIYRGSEDVVNGEVTSEKPKVVFDGSENWLAHATYTTQFGLDVTSFNVKHNGAYAIDCLSNLYQCMTMDAANRPNGSFSIYEGTWGGVSYGKVLVVRDDRFTSVSDFKTALSSVPMELVYELISPTTSSVTPTNLPIRTLSGYNHIESSTGDMIIDYITDAYQNFVDTVESALPNTRKGGAKALDIFLSLEPQEKPETKKEEDAKTNIQEEK